jgi:4-amino-4-deoxy-L-arabinose transferase-like glycosyltransferase
VSADHSAQRGARQRRLAASRSGPAAAVVEVASLGVVLAAAGVLFQRGLDVAPTFDEAVYVAQADALVHGQHLGSQVFAAQPPGFYWLLELAARIGSPTLYDLRLAVLALALAGVAGAYLVGRHVGGPAVGLGAAALLAVAPPYPTYAAQVSADLPGTVLALLALAALLAAAAGGRRVLALAALGGALLAAAELVKLDAFIVVLPLLAFVRRRQAREMAAALAGAAVVAGAAAAALAGVLGDVWHGAVSYHVAARKVAGRYENLHALRSFFDLRQPLTWIAAAGLAATAAMRGPARLWAFWAAAAVGMAFLLWHRPLHDNHMVLLAVLLAVPSAWALVSVAQTRFAPIAVALVLALLAAYVQETRRLERNAGPVPAALVWAAQRVDAHSAPQQLVVSDEPLVGELAHRRLPGEVIDTAVLRFDAGYLSNADVLRAIARYRVPVVVAGRAFLSRPGLLAAFAARFPHVASRDGVRVYVR